MEIEHSGDTSASHEKTWITIMTQSIPITLLSIDGSKNSLIGKTKKTKRRSFVIETHNQTSKS